MSLGSTLVFVKQVGSLGQLKTRLPGMTHKFCATTSLVTTQGPIQITPSVPNIIASPMKRFMAKLHPFFRKDVLVPVPLAFFFVHSTLQCYLGTQDDFFYGSFITKKDPDAIAELYQAEDLLKIIAMHPSFFSSFSWIRCKLVKPRRTRVKRF